MKRHITFALLCAMLCAMLSGCSLWMEGEYVSVEPYRDDDLVAYTGTKKVTTYMQLRNTVIAWVESGAPGGELEVTEIPDGSVKFCMDSAIRYTQKSNPMGAYSVDSINYEIKESDGRNLVSVEINYLYDRSHILRIVTTRGMEGAMDAVREALRNASPSMVLRIPNYTDLDLAQWARSYAEQNLDVIMEIPTVNATVYPNQGVERIVAMEFTYDTDRDTLKQMQQDVESVLTAAELYVENAPQVRDKYAQLYAFLMERHDYTVASSVTPAYSLLHQGVGDAHAFATVYTNMCRRAGLECHTVTGTRNGEPWSWNMINFRGAYYHLDLLRSSERDSFSPMNPSEMHGYEWEDPLS